MQEQKFRELMTSFDTPVADFIADLRKQFSGDIRFDLASRILYSTDASIYQMEPLGVLLPRTQEDLHAAVELAARYRLPLLPRGAGSSLAGQAVGQAVILDVSRWLNRLIAINPEARTATVEPGLVLANLNRAAARFGLQFGPDPASAERATLGGVIGNNATGAHSILYGMTADHLISAETILSDGSLATWEEVDLSQQSRWWQDDSLFSTFVRTALEIRQKYASAIQQHFPHSWRNSAGYRLNYLLPWSPALPPRWDAAYGPQGTRGYPPQGGADFNLAALLAGSEGTLAVIRRATLNLVPKPRHSLLAVRAYASLAEACDDVPRLLQFQPSAVELIPRLIFQLARSIPAYAARLGWLTGDPAAVLVVEFSGDRLEVLRAAAGQIGEVLLIAESAAEQARIWEVRKVGLGLLDARPQPARPVAFIEDCAVPVEHLGEFVREMEGILREHGTEGGIYAHASAGCLHIRPILDLHTRQGVRSLRSIAEQTLALTLRLGGAMSSEHGDGLARGEWLLKTYGAEVMTAMRTLKQAADPHGLLNPGKWFDAPPMDTHLRYDALTHAHPWQPRLDFSRNGGLQTAIEQCNGQGVCRKESGVMCPSFQATREEMHSTRGRANLLRALIVQPAPLLSHNPRLTTAVAQALDLCLACKGCKAECPSGVDMAKLKFEFQYQYYRSHARRLRDYFFAYFNLFAQGVAPLGGMFNRLSRWPLLRRLLHRHLGITENRPLPQFHRLSSVTPPSLPAEIHERVLFLPDAFTHFLEPEIEQAALHLLAACGIEVIRLPLWGAGRSLISKGFLDAAKRHALRLLQAIERLDAAGEMAILGIEPSELNVLRDELADLLPEHSAAIASLSARAWSLEEYLIRPDSRGEKRILRIVNELRHQPEKTAVRVLLHGHCSQKAQPPAADGLPVGQEAAAEFLRAFGLEVEIIPSGCCGMAGAFGYESDHYDLSMQIGELVLFPYLRQRLSAHPLLAAPGTSCRTQIHDGVQVKAQHPVWIAWQQLAAQ